MLPARPGQPVLEFLTSDWFNKVSKRVANKPVGKGQHRDQNFEVVYTYLDEAAGSIGWFEPIMFTDVMYAPSTDPLDTIKTQRIIKGKIPSGSVEAEVWGIVQSPVSFHATCKTVAVGITWAKFERTDPAHKFVNLNQTSWTLKSGDSGPARIISFTATAGDVGYGLILLGASSLEEDTAVFYLPEGATARTGASPNWTAGNGSGTRVESAADTLTESAEALPIYNVSPTSIPSESLVIAHKIGADWYTEWSSGGSSDPQPVLRIFCYLDTSPDDLAADPDVADAYIDDASAIALDPPPFTIMPDLSSGTIPNPLNLAGEVGDGCIIEYNASTGTYFLAHIYPQLQWQMWATVQTNRPTGLQATVSLTPDFPAHIGDKPVGTFTATDLFNVAINAKVGHRVFVQWDLKTSDYIILEAEHTATRCSALLAGGFTASAATFEVDNVLGMDGINPTYVTSLTVHNRFGWPNGVDNMIVEIVWDTHVGQWYGTQMKWTCP